MQIGSNSFILPIKATLQFLISVEFGIAQKLTKTCTYRKLF